MKRDIQLIAEILLRIKESESTLVSRIEIEGYDECTTSEHVYLMERGGLINAEMVQALTPLGIKRVCSYRIQGMTAKGENLTELLSMDKASARAYIKEVGLEAVEAVTGVCVIDLATLFLGYSGH